MWFANKMPRRPRRCASRLNSQATPGSSSAGVMAVMQSQAASRVTSLKVPGVGDDEHLKSSATRTTQEGTHLGDHAGDQRLLPVSPMALTVLVVPGVDWPDGRVGVRELYSTSGISGPFRPSSTGGQDGRRQKCWRCRPGPALFLNLSGRCHRGHQPPGGPPAARRLGRCPEGIGFAHDISLLGECECGGGRLSIRRRLPHWFAIAANLSFVEAAAVEVGDRQPISSGCSRRKAPAHHRLIDRLAAEQQDDSVVVGSLSASLPLRSSTPSAPRGHSLAGDQHRAVQRSAPGQPAAISGSVAAPSSYQVNTFIGVKVRAGPAVRA